MVAETEWVRVRGMGRERFAGHLSDYLTGIGYAVERIESTEPAETRIVAKLVRMNPAIPEGGKELRFRLYPTSGGAAAGWVGPNAVPDAERGRFDRMVREIFAHLERAVLTESHATAKVTRAPDVRLPWESER
ncbi:MAG: hypothetical protein L3J95_02945 [Thermoplasmata archaeon]|nr:hypothetical protein [Thermoplasmata archaeon]MCI4359364.1 hypothetical protein [Thermoplasmata archaeon]